MGEKKIKFVKIDTDLHGQIKEYAANNGLILQWVIDKSVKQYLESQKAIAG